MAPHLMAAGPELGLGVRKGTVLSCSSEDYLEVGAEGSSKGQDDLGEGMV